MEKYTRESLESRLIKSYEAIRKLQQQLSSQGRDEIAVVGMACRLPGGVNSPEAFLDFLLNKGDAVVPVPDNRAADPDDRTIRGGFIDRPFEFDAAHFGISPNEARSMDPQQRLLLEVCHEAMERACIPISDLAGSKTGVFIGQVNNDYGQRSMRFPEKSGIDPWDFTGNIFSTTAGRISFHLGLQGPSMVVDTACSSSLVATDLAVRSLQTRQCSMAIAGGTNLILDGNIHFALQQVQALSETGTCSPFDEDANGYVRSEGVACVVLKPLSKALKDGNPVLAVIKGSAVNHDGKSNGFTAPNSASQAKLIREAIRQSGLLPDQVTCIEAHGTGTRIGDPIEMEALAETYLAERRPGHRLYIGSVKSNIGHTECTAGIAGLIKAVLVIKNRMILPNIHFQKPNPLISWHPDVVIPTEPVEISDEPACVAVSSFGFSGTNAHVILAAGPPSQAEAAGRSLNILLISAKQKESLKAGLQTYIDFLKQTPAGWEDICRTAATGKTHYPFRLAVLAKNKSQAAAILQACLEEGHHAQVLENHVSVPPGVTFAFTGQGSQHTGMGKDLYHHYPAFREALDFCDSLFRDELNISIRQCMFEEESAELLQQTRIAQPAIFSYGYALCAMLTDMGIRAHSVMGHSIGEFAAACHAGILSPEDAVKLVAARSRLMQQMPQGGKMAAVFAGAAPVVQEIASYKEVSVAAFNSPQQTVISGRGDQVAEIVSRLGKRGIRSKYMAVNHAFHSPDMTAMVPAFAQIAGEVSHQAPGLNFISCLEPGTLPSAEYWARHILAPVRFWDGLAKAGRETALILETGASPHLTGIAGMVSPPFNTPVIPVSDKRGDELQAFDLALCKMHIAGINVHWKNVFPAGAWTPVDLPVYRWNHKLFRKEKPQWSGRSGIRQEKQLHPLLGSLIDVPETQELRFQNVLVPGKISWLADHRLAGKTVFPGTGYLEIARAVPAFLNKAACICDLILSAPMEIPDGGIEIQTLVRNDKISIFSHPEGKQWVLHATCRIVNPAHPDIPPFTNELQELHFAPDHFYASCHELGIDYGPAFRGLQKIKGSEGTLTAEVSLPVPENGYYLHPALIDAAFQAYGAWLLSSEKSAYLPMEMQSVWQFADLPPTIMVMIRETFHSPRLKKADVSFFSQAGQPLAHIRGLSLIRTTISIRHLPDHCLYREISVEKPAAVLISGKDIMNIDPELFSEDEKNEIRSVYEQYLRLNSFAAAYIACQLREMGIRLKAGDLTGSRMLISRYSPAPSLKRYIERLFGVLADNGILEATPEEGVFRVIREPAQQDVQTVYRLMREQLAGCRAEAALLDQCASKIAAVVGGQEAPLSVLFPEGNTGAVNELYHTLPFRAMHRLTAQVTSRILSAAGKNARIIEVGAGTGSTSEFILPLCPEGTRYLYTDISPLFLTEAKEKFAPYQFVSYAPLDIEKDVRAQGFTQEYDILIAANVLHATKDLKATFGEVRKLLRPGGLLVMVEGTTVMPWLDLVFGLTKEWWGFRDTGLRSQHILLKAAQWTAFLQENGFGDIRAFQPESAGEQSMTAQTVILAKCLPSAGKGRHAVAGVENNRLASQVAGMLHCNVTAAGETGSLAEQAEANMETFTWFCDQPSEDDQALISACCEVSRLVKLPGTARLRIVLRKNRLLMAALKGIVRTMRLEYPDIQPKLIFIPGQDPDAEDLIREILACDGEETVVMERGICRLERLVTAEVNLSETEVLPVSSEGAYLITGGSGGLGLHFAEWLCHHRAGEVILTSRKQPEKDRLAKLPGKVSWLPCDLGDEKQVMWLFRQIKAGQLPLKGVIHAAGVTADAALMNQDKDHFERVFRAKVAGTRNLIREAKDLSLRFFVAFSSSAATLGMQGQGNHCAANAVMEEMLHQAGPFCPLVRVINWGAWENTGAADSRIEEIARRQGMKPISPEEGSHILETVLTAGYSNLAAFQVDWTRYRQAFGSRPFLEQVTAQKYGPGKASPQEDNWAADLQQTTAGQRMEQLNGKISRLIALSLGYDRQEQIDTDTGFFDLGMDSLIAVSVRNQLQKLTGLQLEATLLFNYATIHDLTRCLLDRLFPPLPAEEPETDIAQMQREDLENFINRAFADGNYEQ